MSVKIRPSMMKVRQDDGTYKNVHIIADSSVDQQLSKITSEGTKQVNAVQSKGKITLASIPADYTALNKTVQSNVQYIEDNKSRLEKIDGLIHCKTQIGNISMNSSGWTYSDNTKRIRTPQGFTIHLQVGDVIALTDYSDARFHIGWREADGTYGCSGWHQKDYTCSKQADYTLLFSNYPQKQIYDINELSSLIKITKKQYHTKNVQKRLSDNEYAINAITTESYNLFDQYTYFDGAGFSTDQNGYIVATASQFYQWFVNHPFIVQDGSSNYSFSADAFTQGNDSTEGEGLQLTIKYSDGTSKTSYFNNSDITVVRKSCSSRINANTVSRIVIGYAKYGTNIWHVKNIQIQRSNNPSQFAHKTCALDPVARNDALIAKERATSLESRVFDIDGIIESTFEIGNLSISTSGWTYSNISSRIRTPFEEEIQLEVGDVITLTDFSDARFYLGWRDSEGNYYKSSDWVSQQYIVTAKAKYVILVSNKTQKTIQNVEQLSSLVSIYRKNKYNVQTGYQIKPTLQDGYFNADGTIANPSSTSKQKYTSNVIGNMFQYIEVELTYTQARSGWLSQVVWYNDGSLVRNVLKSATFTNTRHKRTYGDNVKYVAYSFRTYGDCTFTLTGHGVRNGVVHDRIQETNRSIPSDASAKANVSMYAIMSNPCYDHLFVNKTTTQAVPHESLFHVRLSKAMGFNCIQANIASTSDGVYIVNHLNSGKFGYWFKHVDGTTDISNIDVSSVTWDWIVQNVRYNSTVKKFCTRPPRLEQFLRECRQQGIVPFASIKNDAVRDMLDQYMGSGNYIAYSGTRKQCPDAILYHWQSQTTKDKIVSYCQKYGPPFIYGMANPNSFTDQQLKEIVNALHSKGYKIGTGYVDDKWYKFAALGFDYNGTQTLVNRISVGNMHNIDAMYGFEKFAYTNATQNDGMLTFNSDGTITPDIVDQIVPIAVIDFEIDFTGTISIPLIGQKAAATYESDGSYPVFVSTVIFNGSHKPTITVSSGAVVRNINFKVSKIG